MDVGAAPAKQLLGGGVEFEHAVLGVDHQHRIQRGVQEGARTGLAAAQGLGAPGQLGLCGLAFGDVAHQRQHKGARAPHHAADGDFGLVQAAIAAAVRGLEEVPLGPHRVQQAQQGHGAHAGVPVGDVQRA